MRALRTRFVIWSSGLLLAVAALVGLADPAAAQGGGGVADPMLTLRWEQPVDSAPVDEFRIYKGLTPDLGTRIYTGVPAPDATGIYSTEVQVDEIAEGIPVYVWITAANSAGESAPSDPYVHPEGCDPLADADCDGILDALNDPPCATGQTVGCDDNCPYWPNPGQEDSGGLGFASGRDGIGDACQCGDVSGDGRITLADSIIIRRSGLVPPTAAMSRPELCDVGSSVGCNLADSLIILRAGLTPPTATIQQRCDPALAPSLMP